MRLALFAAVMAQLAGGCSQTSTPRADGSSGTFDATTLGVGTYTFYVSDTGTQSYLTLGIVTDGGSLQASAGPLVSGSMPRTLR